MDVGVLVAVCLTASLSPGPAVLSTVETSLRHGARRTLWHTLGLACGEVPQVAFALGASIFVTGHFPAVRGVVAAAGALYFLWLALRLLAAPRDRLPEGADLVGGRARLFWHGAWVNFSNPKALPWLVIIFQAARVPTDAFSWPVAGLVLLCTTGSEISVMSFYAFLADRLRPWLRTPAAVRGVDRATGLLWLGLAALMGWQAAGLLRG